MYAISKCIKWEWNACIQACILLGRFLSSPICRGDAKPQFLSGDGERLMVTSAPPRWSRCEGLGFEINCCIAKIGERSPVPIGCRFLIGKLRVAFPAGRDVVRVGEQGHFDGCLFS